MFLSNKCKWGFKMIKQYQKNALYMVIVFMLVFSLFIGFVIISNNLDELSQLEIDDISLISIEDGTYSGTSDTWPVYIELNLEVVNHEITFINIIYTNLFVDMTDIDLLIVETYNLQIINFDISQYDTNTAIAYFSAISDALK